MAVRELASVVVVVLSSLMVLNEVSVQVNAALDIDILDTPRDDAYNDIDDMGDNLPGILKLLGVLLETRHSKNKDIGALRDQRPYRAVATGVVPYDKKELTSLLDKLSSSLTQEEQQARSSSQSSYQGVLPILATKRARDELYGAMPPLNELCRMMKVRCF